MRLKTYVAQYIHKYGNGWAIINATAPSQVESILKTQGRFPEVKLVSFKEVSYFGNTMSIVYEGSITTIGQTPYDLAVKNGFKGTLEEWLESLKGPKGDPGDTGPQGPQGDKGDTGEGIASGGTTGQILRKKSNEDYDTEWADESVTSVNGKTGAVELTAEDVDALPVSTPIPDSTSDLLNDSGFITKTADDLVNYYLKTDTYTKDEVQQIVSAIKQFSYEIASSLPTASADTMYKIYLIPSPNSQTQNAKDEYITIQSDSLRDVYDWEQIGSTAIDLSNYYTSSQTDSAITAALNTALANYTTTNDLTTLLAAKANASEMSVVDGTGTDADKTTITLKTGTSATVLKSHQSLAGKQDLIDSSHKLSADLVDDTSTTNKFVTASDKTTWDNKYTKPQTGIPASDLDIGVQTSLGKADTALQPDAIVTPVNATDATLPITTLTCETGVYYRIEVAVDTLAITLPAITDNTTVRTCVIALTTDTTPNVTFTAAAPSGGTAPDIYVADGFEIEASSTYEVNALWNGTNWYIAGIKLINTASV